MMSRRTLLRATAANAALILLNRVASAQTLPKTRNVVLVHELFADGSCWAKVITRLQQKDVNCTSVQNPLTSLHEALEAARRAMRSAGPDGVRRRLLLWNDRVGGGGGPKSSPSSTSPRGHRCRRRLYALGRIT